MQASISQIKDMAEWAGLLKQSAYSWHGHSMEYQEIIQMNDQRHDRWFNFLIVVEGEKYLFAGELFNNCLYSQEKYYAGLIPLDSFEHIETAILVVKDIAKKLNAERVVLSYLETDKVLELILPKLAFKASISPQWQSASVMQVNDYEMIWDHVYPSKTRNMIRRSWKSLEFREINILDHVGDAVDCTWSKPERHGSVMPVYYRDERAFKDRQERIAEILGEQAVSFGAFHKGKLIAYINTIRSHNEAIISNLLSNVNYYQYAPNNGLFDLMIKHYCQDEGIKQLMYSFDGVPGVDKFKHSMGFKPLRVIRCVFEV